MKKNRARLIGPWLLLCAVLAIPRVSAAYPPRPPHSEMWGINAHIPDTSALNRADELGARFIRLDLNWTDMEPSQDVFNWGPWDSAVNGAVARGMAIFATLAYTPSWANGGRGRTYPPTDVNDWRDFVRRVGQRYGNRIDHWGMWNEPNLTTFYQGTKQEYVDKILVPGAQEIKAVDPVAVVCAPELAPSPGDADWNQWMNTVLGQAGQMIDRVTLHEYKDTPAESFQKLDNNVPKILSKYGMSDVEVWLTEIGWRSDEMGEDAQAENYAELIRWVACSNYITKVFPYELRDDPTPSVPKWGIVRSDNSTKPAFTAYQDFILGAGPPYDCSGLTYPPPCGAVAGEERGESLTSFLVTLIVPLGIVARVRSRRAARRSCSGAP